MKNNFSTRLSTGHYIFGGIYLGVQQYLLPILLILAASLLGLRLSDSWFNFIFFSINFLVITIVFHRYLRGELRRFFAKPLACLGIAAAGFALYWVANIYVSVAISFITPDFSNANDASIQLMANDQDALMFAGSVLLVPVVEETLYRGVIFSFTDHFSRPLAYIISTLLIALVHVVGYMGSMDLLTIFISILQYLPAGVFLCWAYARSGTLVAPILIHTAVNLIGMAAMR